MLEEFTCTSTNLKDHSSGGINLDPLPMSTLITDSQGQGQPNLGVAGLQPSILLFQLFCSPLRVLWTDFDDLLLVGVRKGG